MAEITSIKSLKIVLDKLDKANKKMAIGVSKGLKKAGLFLQRESQKIVPIDTAALKNSAFTRSKGTGFDTIVAMGYTVVYAIFVHENLDARHKEGKTAKFIEIPIREKEKDIIRIVKDEAEL